MIGAAFTVGKLGYAAFSGVDAFVDATARFAVKLALKSRAADTSGAEAMVEEMRALVPQDSGRRYNGIGFEVLEGGTVEVFASAINPKDGVDYAGLVERGTRAGTRSPKVKRKKGVRRGVSYVADSNYFNLSTVAPPGRSYERTRMAYRNHPGTEAQPFFFPVVEEVLAKRGQELDEAIAAAADEGGLH